jgi:nucleotide-binding universal stress UspA family protein
MTTILAAVDQSDAAQAMLAVTKALADITGSTTEVLHVRVREIADDDACLALLSRVTTPTVVVPPSARPPFVLRRMVVPLDGTAQSAERARPALDFARRAGLEVIVVHVYDEDRIPCFADQTYHYAHAFGHEFIARYAPQTTAQLELRVGSPADEVLTAAITLHADLLALSWSQALDQGRAHIIKHLIAESPVPLLLLPSPQSKQQQGEAK